VNFENLFRFDEIARNMQELAAKGTRSIVLADLGKNIYPFVRGARQAGLFVLAIADDRFARPGRCYRGVPILPANEALAAAPDAIVVSNTAPVHAAASARRLAPMTQCPIHCWFGV
jgi:hypothetical protein